MSNILKDPEIRDFLKNRFEEEIVGDYDILYNLVKDEKIGEYTFGEHVVLNMPNFTELRSHRILNVNMEAVLTYLQNMDLDLKQYPLLNLSMPFYAGDWDQTSYEPDVVFITKELFQNDSDQDTVTVVGYAANGDLTYYNNKELPENPVLVIGQNERITAVNMQQSKNFRC